MSILNLKISVAFIIAAYVLTGCIKFEDPTISGAPAHEGYASPCSEGLSNNLSIIRTTTTDVLVESFNFINPDCDGEVINANPNEGNFQILLGNPITESGSYDFENNPFPSNGKAYLEFSSSGFAQPVFKSFNGTLYINLDDDGSAILEWCDVTCQAGSGNENRNSTGRIVCE